MSEALPKQEWHDVEPFVQRFFSRSWWAIELNQWHSNPGTTLDDLLNTPRSSAPLFALGQFVFHRTYGRGQIETRVCCRGIWCYRVAFGDYGDRYFAQAAHEPIFHSDVITELSAQSPALRDQLMPTEEHISPSLRMTNDGSIVRLD